jgi:hypothetical protein
VGATGRRSGRTTPGATGWLAATEQRLAGRAVYVDVDTSKAGFQLGAAPHLFSSLLVAPLSAARAKAAGVSGAEGANRAGSEGDTVLYPAEGGDVTYCPTTSGFRVYLSYYLPVTPAMAEAYGWTVAWAGVDSDTLARDGGDLSLGSGPAVDWAALPAHPGAASMRVTVKPAAGAGGSKVSQGGFTFLAGLSGTLAPHVDVLGAGTVYSPVGRIASATGGGFQAAAGGGAAQQLGFTMYLHPSTGAAAASASSAPGLGFTVVYLAVEGPVDCAVSVWGHWQACSVSCGGGQQVRDRNVTQIAVSSMGRHGRQCPRLFQSRQCNSDRCPAEPCQVKWSNWSQCTVTCNGGHQHRQARVVRRALWGGAACPALHENAPCNGFKCPPVDCKLTAWTPFTPCTASCGGGTRTRSRKLVASAKNAGTCPKDFQQVQRCSGHPCAIDCKITGWTDWEPDAKHFDAGGRCLVDKATRSRRVLVRSAYGGTRCPTGLKQSRPDLRPCVGGGPIKSVGAHGGGGGGGGGGAGGAAESPVCGGVTPASATRWQTYGSHGLYLEVDTSQCSFAAQGGTPQYAFSVVGRAQDALFGYFTGSSALVRATPTGFVVVVTFEVLSAATLLLQVQKYRWQLSWVGSRARSAGVTITGATAWQQHTEGKALYLDVDTRGSTRAEQAYDPAAGASDSGGGEDALPTPRYFPALIQRGLPAGFKLQSVAAAGGSSSKARLQLQQKLKRLKAEKAKARAAGDSPNALGALAKLNQEEWAAMKQLSALPKAGQHASGSGTGSGSSSGGGSGGGGTGQQLGGGRGGDVVYAPTASGFRVYVVSSSALNGRYPLTPERANAWGWTVSYIADADAARSGGGQHGKWKLQDDAILGRAAYTDVDTAGSSLREPVQYVASLVVHSKSWQVSTGAVLSHPTTSGFRVYTGRVSAYRQEFLRYWSVSYLGFKGGCSKVRLLCADGTKACLGGGGGGGGDGGGGDSADAAKALALLRSSLGVYERQQLGYNGRPVYMMCVPAAGGGKAARRLFGSAPTPPPSPKFDPAAAAAAVEKARWAAGAPKRAAKAEATAAAAARREAAKTAEQKAEEAEEAKEKKAEEQLEAERANAPTPQPTAPPTPVPAPAHCAAGEAQFEIIYFVSGFWSVRRVAPTLLAPHAGSMLLYAESDAAEPDAVGAVPGQHGWKQMAADAWLAAAGLRAMCVDSAAAGGKYEWAPPQTGAGGDGKGGAAGGAQKKKAQMKPHLLDSTVVQASLELAGVQKPWFTPQRRSLLQAAIAEAFHVEANQVMVVSLVECGSAAADRAAAVAEAPTAKAKAAMREKAKAKAAAAALKAEVGAKAAAQQEANPYGMRRLREALEQQAAETAAAAEAAEAAAAAEVPGTIVQFEFVVPTKAVAAPLKVALANPALPARLAAACARNGLGKLQAKDMWARAGLHSKWTPKPVVPTAAPTLSPTAAPKNVSKAGVTGAADTAGAAGASEEAPPVLSDARAGGNLDSEVERARHALDKAWLTADSKATVLARKFDVDGAVEMKKVAGTGGRLRRRPRRPRRLLLASELFFRRLPARA